MTDQQRAVQSPTTTVPTKPQPSRTYVTPGGASSAGRDLRSKDPQVRSEAAKYMAQYRAKKKSKQ